jgi:DHA1 family tetracycline resistance protein-like MFS transporter
MRVGWALAVVGVSFVIVQVRMVGPVVASLGERRALVTGLFAGAIGFSIYGVAPSGWIFILGIPIMSIWGLYGPSAQGLMTRRVKPNEQGALQGALTSIAGLTGIVGPAIFSETFAVSISSGREWHVPGAPYLLAALILLVAIAVAWRATSAHSPAATPIAV